MSDQLQGAASAPTETPPEAQRIGLEALATAVGSAAQDMARMAQVEAITSAGFAIILAAMPETARLRPERILAALGALLKDKPLEMQQQVGAFINGIIMVSNSLADALAKAEAEARAEHAKGGNAGGKPN